MLVSGSMSPRLVPGDVIFADQVDHPVPLGTVLAFEDPASDDLLTHRVVDVLPDGSYRTQGDANASADSTPVPPAAVVYDCDTAQTSCTPVGSTATVASTGSWSGGSNTWVAKDWNLGNLGSPAGERVLPLRVVVPKASQGDMWFAYDATAYPAALTAG